METVEIRWRIPSIFWLPIIICLCLLFIVDVFQLKYYTITPTRVQLEDFLDEKSLKGFLIKTPGCRIPYMDPFDHTIKNFIRKPKPTKCNKGLPPLIESNLTSIFLLNSSLIDYEIDNLGLLNCCYQAFWRKVPEDDEMDNKIVTQEDCIEFNDSTDINQEFIKVKCSYDNVTIYKDFFSFVPIKIIKEKRKQEQLNVLVVGIDAVSRLNFHRQMPKTVDYLLNNISGIELLGYNKVADNTFPNLIPVLTGLDESQLTKQCWADSSTRFDHCPFIWNDYKTKGYLTSFGEDAAWMGLFNYQKQGFIKQPTDYMWGIFNIISEQQIGNSHKLNVYECVGARNVYKVFLDYIFNFSMKMYLEKLPYFGFYWGSSLSHDILNRPNIGDNDYYQFFYKLKTNNLLNNTVLIVMSDHGIRWGSIRQTFQGRMEERLPFIFFILPDWFKLKYPKAYRNLKKNIRRLTSPFDLHETLKDLLNNPDNNLTKEFPQNQTNHYRGYSLFNEISPKRTCDDAGISTHWCTCQESTEIITNDSSVIKASLFAVQHMNSLLIGYRQCANLSLLAIINARIMTHGDHIFKGDKTEDYMITLKTSPNDGVFETTVRFKPVNSTYHLEIIGTISRLNLYGQQSACITDFHLKLYCYCKSLM